jgi:hypothetical protein
MSEVAIVETWKQHARVGAIQSIDACITTTIVEMVVAPKINVIKRGVLIEYVTKLDSKLRGVSIVRNLNRSLALPRAITTTVGTHQIMFANLIMNIHVNMTVNQRLMSLMAIGGYKSADVTNPTRRY